MTGTLSTQVVMKENPSTEEQSERGTDAPQPPPLPTLEQSAAYQRAWAYFNEALFDGRLEPCLLNLSRHRGSEGFFAAKRWQKGDEMIHEISLNPDLLRSPPEESLGTLVHEMVHQWQEDHGTPSRGNYHNSECADKMEEIGLIPSSTGEPGGKRTGQRMSHYIDAEGCFARTLREMPGDCLLPWAGGTDADQRQKPRARRRVKLTCRGCEKHVWVEAKDAGHRVECGECRESFATKAGLRGRREDERKGE